MSLIWGLMPVPVAALTRRRAARRRRAAERDHALTDTEPILFIDAAGAADTRHEASRVNPGSAARAPDTRHEASDPTPCPAAAGAANTRHEASDSSPGSDAASEDAP
jgi:hypothetical protein